MLNPILIYKKVGETPLEAIDRYRNSFTEFKDIKMTYAGRLDPMAEGLLLCLYGDDVHMKDEYLNLSKTYEFEILFDIKTDTGDVLGVVEDVRSKSENILNQTKTVIETYQGEHLLNYPKFSSKTVNGLPLWKHFRDGEGIELPKRTMNIYALSYIESRSINTNNLLSYVQNKISLVKGDFRQNEVLSSWGKLTEYRDWGVVKFTADVSSGTYIRSVAQDIAELSGTCGLAFSIKRIKIGDFLIENAWAQ